MIAILFSSVICAVGTVVFLLFQRLKALSRQLTLLRVEHEAQQILQAIGLSGNLAPRPQSVAGNQQPEFTSQRGTFRRPRAPVLPLKISAQRTSVVRPEIRRVLAATAVVVVGIVACLAAAATALVLASGRGSPPTEQSEAGAAPPFRERARLGSPAPDSVQTREASPPGVWQLAGASAGPSPADRVGPAVTAAPERETAVPSRPTPSPSESGEASPTPTGAATAAPSPPAAAPTQPEELGLCLDLDPLLPGLELGLEVRLGVCAPAGS